MKYLLVVDSTGREYLLDSGTGEILKVARNTKFTAIEILNYFNLDFNVTELN